MALNHIRGKIDGTFKKKSSFKRL